MKLLGGGADHPWEMKPNSLPELFKTSEAPENRRTTKKQTLETIFVIDELKKET